MRIPKVLVPKKMTQGLDLDWVIGWELPEFEGLTRETIQSDWLFAFLHPIQESGGWLKGTVLLKYLTETGLIANCLNLSEGGILMADRDVLSDRFGWACVYLWRSVAYDVSHNLFVPFIQNIRGQHPVVYWYWLEYPLDVHRPAAMIDPLLLSSSLT